jgi:hypothetical protein
MRNTKGKRKNCMPSEIFSAFSHNSNRVCSETFGTSRRVLLETEKFEKNQYQFILGTNCTAINHIVMVLERTFPSVKHRSSSNFVQK